MEAGDPREKVHHVRFIKQFKVYKYGILTSFRFDYIRL